MKNKISYKLIYYIFIISFIITSISAYFQLSSTYKNEMDSFKKDINNIEKNRLPILAQSLWTVNTESTNIFLDNLINDEKIIYAEIIEPDEKTTKRGVLKKEDVIVKEFKINKQFGEDTNYLGKLILVADLKPLYSKLRSYAFTTITSEIIKMLLISLLIIFVIKKFLTNKIENMASYAKQLKLDTLDKPFNTLIKDSEEDNNELDVVANSIDEMRRNLLEQINKSREKDNILAHQAKMAAMGEMIGNIAHQWRQPLSMISTTATGLKVKHEVDILDEEDLINSLDSINNSIQYLSSTIDDFRNFFKPNKEKTSFQLADIFESVFALSEHQFKIEKIILEKKIEDVELYGFQNELVQAIINILNNAKDALHNNSEEKLIFIENFNKEDETTILIKDNAGGIDKDLISRIFEPYFTTKDKMQGTGIGLYICEQIIVKHMQGSIVVKNVEYEYNNTKYKGAQFTIKLPINL